MAQASTSRVPRGPVTATLNFFKPPADGSEPVTYADGPPEGLPQYNYGLTPHAVTITDVRGREADFTLDRDAFQIVLGVPESTEKSFGDDASITQNYYPEVEALLRAHIPDVTRVIIFDHTVRRSDPDAARSPVQAVHIDQTAQSAAQRVQKHLPPDEAERFLMGRYRIINVWRPLNARPVETFPLAYARSETLADEDIVPVVHRYKNGYNGQTAGIKYSPKQEWFYLSGIMGNERILLECFDSEALREGTSVKGGRVAHTAFEDSRSLPDAEGRESIEVRALVFGP